LQKVDSAAREDNLSFRETVFDTIIEIEKRAEVEVVRACKIIL
jgi:hypothetical protein